jgi:glycosyltransferase involved in cell wall biosynthesis
MILTIAIPTYNRPEKVRRTIKALVPQLTQEVKVTVFDNCTDVVIEDDLKANFSTGELAQVKVFRHPVNVGADVNFCSCFENCDTEYIWMLGDDDHIMDNAIALIFQEIETYKNEDVIGFNFYTNCVEAERQSPVFIRSTHELAHKLDSFGNWLFISSTVYKTKAYQKHLHKAAWGTYAMASQLVPAMMAINEGKLFVLSEKHTVDTIRITDLTEKWSDYQLAMGISTLLEAPVGFKNDDYYVFGKKLSYHFSYIWPVSIVYTILKSVDFNIDLIDDYHVYIYKQMFLKTLDFRKPKVRQYRQYLTYLPFLKNRKLFKLLYKMRPGMRQHAEKETPFYLFKR